MNRLDLLLQIELLALHQHALGDVDDHGARVLPVRLGLAPPLHPDRLAVVFAAKLQLHAGMFLALLDRGERFAHARQNVRGDERDPQCAGDIFGLQAEQPHRGAVGVDESRIQILVDVRDRRLLIEIAIALFAGGEHLLIAQPLELRGSPRGEDSEDEQPARLAAHRPLVEHRQVPQRLAVHPAQRHVEITFDPHLPEAGIFREFICDLVGMMTQASADDVFTGRAEQIPFEVRREVIHLPVGQRAGAHLAGKLRDKRVSHANRASEVPNQRLKEILPGARSGPFHDRAQGLDLVRRQRRWIGNLGHVARLTGNHLTFPVNRLEITAKPGKSA